VGEAWHAILLQSSFWIAELKKLPPQRARASTALPAVGFGNADGAAHAPDDKRSSFAPIRFRHLSIEVSSFCIGYLHVD
jgi:hypothetical protein